MTIYPNDPASRAAVERFEATIEAIAAEAAPLVAQGAALHARLDAAMQQLRTDLRSDWSGEAQLRRRDPLSYSPFVPPTVEALTMLARAAKGRTGAVGAR